MERDILDIVTKKKYFELTDTEKLELQEVCSTEEEFDQLKYVMSNVSTITWNEDSPKPETKAQLDDIFAETHPKAAPVWYTSVLTFLAPADKPFYRQPILQLAAVGLLVLLALPLFDNSTVKSPSNPVVASNNIQEEESIPAREEAGDKKNQEASDQSLKQSGISESNEPIDANRISMDFTATSDVTTLGGTLPAGTFRVDVEGVGVSTELTFATNATVAVEESELAVTALDRDGEHPDGIFTRENETFASQPASRNPSVLDLLTTTF